MIISQKKGSDLFEPLFADIVGSMYGKLVDAYGKKNMVNTPIPWILRGSFRSLSTQLSFPARISSCEFQFGISQPFLRETSCTLAALKQSRGNGKWMWSGSTEAKRRVSTQKTNMTMKHQPFEDVLPCTSHWKWGFSFVMLVFNMLLYPPGKFSTTPEQWWFMLD